MNSLFALFGTILLSLIYHVHYLYLAYNTNIFHMTVSSIAVVWMVVFLYNFFTGVFEKKEHES